MYTPPPPALSSTAVPDTNILYTINKLYLSIKYLDSPAKGDEDHKHYEFYSSFMSS